MRHPKHRRRHWPSVGAHVSGKKRDVTSEQIADLYRRCVTADARAAGLMEIIKQDSPSNRRITSVKRETGIVKWFSDPKGFGFITRDNSEPDCFVHYSEIGELGPKGHVTVQKGFKSLDEGDSVEFEVIAGTKGPAASKVTKGSREDVEAEVVLAGNFDQFRNSVRREASESERLHCRLEGRRQDARRGAGVYGDPPDRNVGQTAEGCNRVRRVARACTRQLDKIMKADMRAPMAGGTEYLLIIEAETDLEKTVLGHFARSAMDAARELRINYAVPVGRESGCGGLNFNDQGCATRAIFLASEARAPVPNADAPSVIDQQHRCGVVRCCNLVPQGIMYCADHQNLGVPSNG